MAFPLGGFRQTNAATTPPSGPAGGQLSGTYPNPTLAYYFNPIEYGAVGNGVADDNAALVLALAAAGAGGVVDLVGKTYYTSVPLTIATNGTTVQNGTITTVPAATACRTFIVTGTDVTFLNVTCIRGTATGGLVTSSELSNVDVGAVRFTALACTMTNANLAAVIFRNGAAAGSKLISCRLSNSSTIQDSSCVLLQAGAASNDNIRVIACSLSGACSLGIGGFGAKGCVFAFNHITGMTKPAASVGGYAIVLYQNATETVRDNRVIGNVIDTVAGFGTYLAADQTTCTHNLFSGNTIRGAATAGDQGGGLPYSAIGINGGASTTIAECNVKTTTSVPGLYVKAGSVRIVGTIVESAGAEGFSIQSNNVHLTGCTALTNTAQGFYAAPAKSNISFVDCLADGNTDNGFTIQTVTSVLLSGCIATNNVQRGIQLGSCVDANVTGCESFENINSDVQIYIENAASTRVTVSECRVGHSGVNAYGIQIGAAGTDCQVRNCDSKGINQAARRILTNSNSQRYAGVYTPTLFNTTNVAASTAYECQFVRAGNLGAGDTVTVSGKVDVDPTAAGATLLGISLPIPSNLGAVEDCAGTAFASAIAGQGAAILGDAANDRASMSWVAVDFTNQPMYFTFTYQVI